MRKTTYLLFITILLMIFLNIIFTQGYLELEKKVNKYILPNGLRVLLLERHDAPVVSFVTWANVGAVNEVKGITGIAHLFEHMAFKGTPTVGTTDFSNELKAIEKEIEVVARYHDQIEVLDKYFPLDEE